MTTLPPTPSAPVVFPGWIACSERMPEPDVDVLLLTNAGFVTYGWRRLDMYGWHIGRCNEFAEPGQITRWQHLPPPPTDSPENGK